MAAGVAGESKAAHNVGEREGLQACRGCIAEDQRVSVHCKVVPDDVVPEPGNGAKKVHFIRHGEGYHNVAQREWRSNPDWDGTSEPYTPDNDPDSIYCDAELTETGRGQAKALQERTSALRPELLVVSPMRRATQTGLIAFEQHVSTGALKVVANELCHERAGRHTCDMRLAKGRLSELFPKVDYSGLEHEDDPFWGDGSARESLPNLAARAAKFIEWLMAQPGQHLAVAAHSAFLLAVFNAVLVCDSEATGDHFATGEMRTVVLTPSIQQSAVQANPE